MANPGLIFSGNSGCLLPFLIIFNLLFGKLIFESTRLWLGIEAILILIFLLKMHIFFRRLNNQFNTKGRQGEVVDIQGQVIEEEKRLK